MKVKTVYITCGPKVITTSVVNALKALGIQVIFLGGNDRFETSINIAKALDQSKISKIVVTTAWKNADALSMSPIAASQDMPILLSDVDTLSTETANYINSLKGKITKSYVIGKAAVVGDKVAQVLPSPTRIAGDDRFGTNIEILKTFASDLKFDRVYMGQGLDGHLVDALVSSALAIQTSSPLLLTDETLPTVAENFISANLSPTSVIVALGSAGVITDTVLNHAVSKIPTTILVKSIALSKNGYNTYNGETFTLSATVNPSNAANKAVTWSSSNPGVAKTDNNGNVTAVAPGQAKITATAQDGTNVKAECVVNVSNPVSIENALVSGEAQYQGIDGHILLPIDGVKDTLGFADASKFYALGSLITNTTNSDLTDAQQSITVKVQSTTDLTSLPNSNAVKVYSWETPSGQNYPTWKLLQTTWVSEGNNTYSYTYQGSKFTLASWQPIQKSLAINATVPATVSLVSSIKQGDKTVSGSLTQSINHQKAPSIWLDNTSVVNLAVSASIDGKNSGAITPIDQYWSADNTVYNGQDYYWAFGTSAVNTTASSLTGNSVTAITVTSPFDITKTANFGLFTWSKAPGETTEAWHPASVTWKASSDNTYTATITNPQTIAQGQSAFQFFAFKSGDKAVVKFDYSFINSQNATVSNHLVKTITVTNPSAFAFEIGQTGVVGEAVYAKIDGNSVTETEFLNTIYSGATAFYAFGDETYNVSGIDQSNFSKVTDITVQTYADLTKDPGAFKLYRWNWVDDSTGDWNLLSLTWTQSAPNVYQAKTSVDFTQPLGRGSIESYYAFNPHTPGKVTFDTYINQNNELASRQHLIRNFYLKPCPD